MVRAGAVALIVAALCARPTPVVAAVTARFSFAVAKAPHPLAADPTFSDPGWAAGVVPQGTGDWIDLTTHSAAAEPTIAYVLYDDRALYLGFRATQGSEPIATQSTNDVGFGIDDFVGVGIDTSGTGARLYYFMTTPRGTRYEQASENARYRPQWQAAATRTAQGWNAAMVIPLSALRIAGGSPQAWRFQFVRQLAARGEHEVWAYDGAMVDGASGAWPAFFDARWWAQGMGLQFGAAARPKPEPRADVYGLESVGGDRNLFVQANGTFVPTTVRPAGIDFSYPLTPTMSFVGTLNPDFSNVEIDQQIITPQEFPRQLTEYRPFFSQGANFISAASGPRSTAGAVSTNPYLVFYSPDIGPFDRGAKVEGTFGQQSLGVLSFRGFDETSGNTFDDQAFGYERAAPNGSLLYWSDGVFAHHSIAGNDDTIEAGAEGHNYTSGFTWFVDHSFENGSWVPNAHADLSETFVDLHRTFFDAYAGYFDVSPNYNPIDGYTANSDIRGPMGFLNLFGSMPGVKNYTVSFVADRFVDESGAVHQADTGLAVVATFSDGLSLDGAGPSTGQLRSYGVPAGPGCKGPIVATTSFTGYPCYLDGSTAPYNLYSIPIGYKDGTPAPYDANYAWGPFGSDYVHLFNAATSRPIGKRLTIALAYDGTYERSFANGILDSQWLRSVTLGYTVGPESAVSLELRNINGFGGFATAVGTNLAASFHQRFNGGNELWINYGSPAAGATIDRLIVKYVFHAGAESGT
ncbi:MAG: hypothetical protein JO192_04045 [Candidatus Eremiobacteraeota bacterium]|nr:hypothetical protein [Candidatus Eremiobacteraeota bacterium]